MPRSVIGLVARVYFVGLLRGHGGITARVVGGDRLHREDRLVPLCREEPDQPGDR